MFNTKKIKKLEQQVSEIKKQLDRLIMEKADDRKTINSLSNRVHNLENPPRFMPGDRVGNILVLSSRGSIFDEMSFLNGFARALAFDLHKRIREAFETKNVIKQDCYYVFDKDLKKIKTMTETALLGLQKKQK